MKNINYKNKPLLIVTIGLLIIIGMTGCKKLVDIPAPADQIVENNVYKNDATAISVLTGIYINMSQVGSFTGPLSISVLCGLQADELSLFDGASSLSHIGYYQNKLSALENIGSEHWSSLYNYIFRCNAAIEGLTTSTTITPAVKQQLLGEAKFLRAFYYFYLVNLFGDVPRVISTDYTANALLGRATSDSIYQQIVADLKEAKNVLSADYLDERLYSYAGSGERVRPTKWAASALLARVYLYAGFWAEAEAEASLLINEGSLFALSQLNEVFLANDNEAIWQLQPVSGFYNTEDGKLFNLTETGPNSDTWPVYLSPQVLSSFESGDLRRFPGNYVDSVTVEGNLFYFPYKYKNNTIGAPLSEYLMVFRLTEQYLIRAEARTQLGNVSGAQIDLNTIRARAALPNTTATDKGSLLSTILHERQVELFTEWGHRWLDLKRTNTIDEVMSTVTPLKSTGSAWESYQQWSPLPLSDIQKAPNLIQNEGY